MCRQNTDDDSEDHAKDKWYHIKPTAGGKAISYIILYLLFIIVDSHDIFPWRHDVAIFAGATATIALLYAEAFAIGAITSRAWIVLSLGVCLIAVALNFYVGPNLPEETDSAAYLIPSNKPKPFTFCDALGIAEPPEAVAFIIGSNEFSTTFTKLAPIITLDNKVIISMRKSEKGLLFSVDMFDLTEKLVAKIQNNNGALISARYSYKERSEDRSILTLYDDYDKEILYIDYLNPQTVLIRGVFTGPSGTTIAVDDNWIHRSIRIPDGFAHNCWTNARGGFSLSKHSISMP